MAVRTKQLALWNQAMVGTTRDLYTCPAGATAIVKHATVMNLAGGPRDVGLAVRRATERGQIAWSQQLANLGVLDVREAFHVLEPGDVLELFVGAGTGTGPIRVIVSGSELDGVAP